MRQRTVLIDVAIALALASVVVVGYKLAPRLLPRSAPTPVTPVACDLNASPCAAELPHGGRVELAITPRPIPLVRPLTVSARVTGIEAERVDIEFSGVDMDMGDNRATLVAEGAGGTSDHTYRASAMLPVCVSGRMDWRATLRVRSGGRESALAFVFWTPATAD